MEGKKLQEAEKKKKRHMTGKQSENRMKNII
jgi:hypothetical protein